MRAHQGISAALVADRLSRLKNTSRRDERASQNCTLVELSIDESGNNVQLGRCPVKEKFGGLRILCESCHDAIRQRIFAAEQEPLHLRGLRPVGETSGSGLMPCATNKRAHTEQESMAELSQDQLWRICLRKPSDCEPYGTCTRLTACDC